MVINGVLALAFACMQEHEHLQKSNQQARTLQLKVEELSQALRIVSEQRDQALKQVDSERSLIAARDEELGLRARQKGELEDAIRRLELSVQQAAAEGQKFSSLQVELEQVGVGGWPRLYARTVTP